MTTEDLAPGGVQPEITASTAAPEPEKVDDMVEGAKAPEATPEAGKQPDAAKTQDDEAKAASEAGKALNKHKQTASERVQQAVTRQREAEREAQRLRDRLAQFEGKIKAPNPDETDPAKYQADHLDYRLDQRRVQDLKDQHDDATREAEQARALAWNERVQDFKVDNPDFEQVAFAAPIGRETSLMVADMEDGPAVAYHLGKNPAEARRIEALPERQRAFALGKVAAQITAPPPRRITSAPPPVDTATGKSGGGPAPDASKVDMDEYARLRKSGWRG